MRVVVYGLWHLGCVTAACLASGLAIRSPALIPTPTSSRNCSRGQPPLQEPGLPELIATGWPQSISPSHRTGRRLAQADILWVTFDTPVNEQDEADVAFVRDSIGGNQRGPAAGHAGADFFASSGRIHEILAARLADKGIAAFRLFAGELAARQGHRRLLLCRNVLFLAFRKTAKNSDSANCSRRSAARIEWMSLESAEMTKHALNAFLATSVTFINELARLCEEVGAGRQGSRARAEDRGPDWFASIPVAGRGVRGRHIGARSALSGTSSARRCKCKRQCCRAC